MDSKQPTNLSLSYEIVHEFDCQLLAHKHDMIDLKWARKRANGSGDFSEVTAALDKAIASLLATKMLILEPSVNE